MITYDFGSGENVFFTSDTHWGHSKILELCNRPFNSVEEMDKVLIDNWNSKVGKNDIVFHLGDFCFKGAPRWREILEQLNGNIYLILGNHDEKNVKDNITQYFTHITYQMAIHIDGWKLYLNHYPFLCYGGAWNPDRRVAQAFGHLHSTIINNSGKDFTKMPNLFPSQYEVGVDFNNFTPLSWNEFKNKIEFQIQNNVNQLYWIKS